jgi:hypothetical protein
MKTTDFIKENFVTDAAEAHQDHEVQMARSDCYNAAKYAIELHKLLKNISEQQGLEGWVSEKITLANDYLRTVTEYLRYEQESSARSDMPDFDIGSATQTLDSVLGESVMSAMQEGAFTWYLKAHGRLLSPLTSDEPYKFNSKEEAIAFAKQKYKTNWQNIVPTTYDVPDSLAGQHDPGWDGDKLKPVQEDDYDDAVAAFLDKNKPVQGKTHPPRSAERLGGSRHIAGRGEAGRGKVGRLGKSAKSEPVGKPVVTAEATGDKKFDSMMGKVVSDPWTKIFSNPNFDEIIEAFCDRPLSKFEEKMRQSGIEVSEDGDTLNPQWLKYYIPFSTKMAQKFILQHKLNPNDPDLIMKVRHFIDWQANEGEPAGLLSGHKLPLDTVKVDNPRWDDAMDAMRPGVDKILQNINKPDRYDESAGGMGAGSVATSMGGGNGFANGGPGTIARPKMKKKK